MSNEHNSKHFSNQASTQKNHENKPKNSGLDFNYFITKFFLNNSRLTILSLALLIILGVGSVFLLKTTGFPSPEIKVALVQTIYPGASSETVNKDVTIPLEGAIKNISGVKRFSSTSNNSFSNIAVTIDENADADSVKNKIDSAVKSITLPENAQTPKIVTPEIGGPDLILAITNTNSPLEQFKASERIIKDLNQLPEVSNVTELNKYSEQVIVKIDENKAKEAGFTVTDIQNQLATLGETLPVVSNVAIENKNAGITTTIKGSDLESLKNFTLAKAPSFSPQAPTQSPTTLPQTTKLSQVADINLEYRFQEKKPTALAFSKDNNQIVTEAVILEVKAVKNSDQSAFIKSVNAKLSSYDNAKFVKKADLSSQYDPNKTIIVETLAVNDDNQEQVNEVIGGLIGSPISQLGGAQNLGYFLGGIQLVFLTMLAFVSWRAALVAATAIPLSLAFSTIYLYITGSSLNTLTLFSLVLVIGLVVDPALVVLEAIQRKIDVGLKGKKAVLEGIKDVGTGIFLASLTNIIVFVPFGVLTGIFGQIFAFIPLTIVPAVIGSYIVPLIFLAWLGGLILKPNKKAVDDEEKNLWPIARWVINIDYKILNGSRLVRLIIIIVALAIPLSLAGFMFSSGQIKSVQFASGDDSDILTISGSYLPTITQEEKNSVAKDILKIAVENENVVNIIPANNNFDYSIFLKPQSKRETKAKNIAESINQKIQTKYGKDAGSNTKFFDVQVGVIQTGGPTTDYQVAVLVKTDDSEKLRTASLAISKTMQEKLCQDGNSIVIKDNCSNDNKIITKIDDGFTNKENFIYEFQFSRDLLIQSGVGTLGRGPILGNVNSLLKTQFEYNNNKSVAKVSVNGSEREVFIESKTAAPQTTSQIKSNLANSVNIPGIPSSVVEGSINIEETKPKTTIQRQSGQTIGLVQGRVKAELENNQGLTSQANAAVVNYYAENNGQRAKDLGLNKENITLNANAAGADGTKFLSELLIALVLAIIVSYIVLALFFNSLLQPLAIIFTIPLTFLGVFPALYFFVGGEFGFLEIIGLIILIGVVENVAIFLIDSARQKVDQDGWSDKRAISYAAGVRFRPVILTKFTAIASLAPLAVLSPFYRSIAVVIIFGLLSSGFPSLITTPILFVFFKWLSEKYLAAKWWNKLIFFVAFPIYIIVWGIMDRPKKLKEVAEV